jgi:hypothetical protein
MYQKREWFYKASRIVQDFDWISTSSKIKRMSYVNVLSVVLQKSLTRVEFLQIKKWIN